MKTYIEGILTSMENPSRPITQRMFAFAQRHGAFRCVCGQPATVVVSLDGYCERHKHRAIERPGLRRFQAAMDLANLERLENEREFTRQQLRHRTAMKVAKFSKG